MVLPHLRHSQRECQSEGSWVRCSHSWKHTERLIFSGRVKINLNREVNMGKLLKMYLKDLACRTRFELVTSHLGGGHSILLS